MKSLAAHERLAVCSWSVQPSAPDDLVQKIRATGVRRVQLALDPLRESPSVWGGVESLLRENQLTAVSGMVACLGEDYSTLDSIRRTGGVAPDATWERNLENFQACADIAQALGLTLVTLHAGFLPPDDSHPGFGKMLRRLGAVADVFKRKNVIVGLETGQETAPELAGLLRQLNHPNVGVNFDPANMILYDKGDPVEALRTLAVWIRQVHIKDATRTKVAGAWGEEVPAGSGEVDWVGFFSALKEVSPSANLVIEREAGSSRVADIRTARDMVERLLK